jgi:hypothetical protein
MAARRSEQPLYLVFLARVINIEAVQRHRAAVTDDETTQFLFFIAGCRPKLTGNFHWSLDAPEEDFPGAPAGAPFDLVLTPISLPMQSAWDAAVAAFEEFIKEIKNGELIASASHPATGLRRDLDPAEWTREGLILDVRNGDLMEVRTEYRGKVCSIKHTVRWASITLRATKQPRQKKARGHGHDWAGVWAYALTLRADDRWDWKKYRRDKNQPLPAVHKVVEDKIKNWFEAKGNVPNIRDIRQNVMIPLYAGRRTRNNRKR